MRTADADSSALRRLLAKHVLFIAESRSRRTASNCNVKIISCFIVHEPILASTIRRADQCLACPGAAALSRQKARIRFSTRHFAPALMRRARHLIDACTRAIKINPTSLRSFTNVRLGRRDMHAASLSRARIAAPRFIGGASSAARLERRAIAPVVSRGVGATWKINRGFSVVVESAEGDVEGGESAEGVRERRAGGGGAGGGGAAQKFMSEI